MKTFSAQIELPDAYYNSMMDRASGQTDVEMVNSIVSDWCKPYAAADEQAALTKLIPKGLQYEAAPTPVKEQVDALLAPYQS